MAELTDIYLPKQKPHEINMDGEECCIGHGGEPQCRRCIHCGAFIRPFPANINQPCPAREYV